jgi:hypothetical protein
MKHIGKNQRNLIRVTDLAGKRKRESVWLSRLMRLQTGGFTSCDPTFGFAADGSPVDERCSDSQAASVAAMYGTCLPRSDPPAALVEAQELGAQEDVPGLNNCRPSAAGHCDSRSRTPVQADWFRVGGFPEPVRAAGSIRPDAEHSAVDPHGCSASIQVCAMAQEPAFPF